jgi:hypothetical protein
MNTDDIFAQIANSNATEEIEFLRKTATLTYRAKIALPLIYAEHISSSFSFEENQDTLISKALNSAWQWIDNQSIHAYEIYLNIQPLHELSQEVEDDEKASAILSLISALYYTAWKADGYDFTDLGIDNRARYGGDFFEISESASFEAKDYALEATDDPKNEKIWQDDKLDYMIKNYKALKITREYY